MILSEPGQYRPDAASIGSVVLAYYDNSACRPTAIAGTVNLVAVHVIKSTQLVLISGTPGDISSSGAKSSNEAVWLDLKISGLILGLRPANERRRYKVTPSLIGWAQT